MATRPVHLCIGYFVEEEAREVMAKMNYTFSRTYYSQNEDEGIRRPFYLGTDFAGNLIICTGRQQKE